MLRRSSQRANACKCERHSAAAAHHDTLYRLALRRSNLVVDWPSPTARILINTSVSWVALFCSAKRQSSYIVSYLSPWASQGAWDTVKRTHPPTLSARIKVIRRRPV
jgi:hypothetical protein